MRLEQGGDGNLPLRVESWVTWTALDQIWLYATPKLLFAPKVVIVFHVGVLTRPRQRKWQAYPRYQINILAFSDICSLD